jgi:DHA1 family bicyclomycin/chloramphenicol resistance-like MFS transporter/DHA1 family 2-module integral membrane pump EmrD-like MFS transporter
VAPFLGGYFQQYLGWHATFIFLLGWIVFVTAVILFCFKETSQHHGKHRLNLTFIGSAYAELLSSRKFMGFCLCVFLSYGGLFTWMTAGPVILIHGAHISPVMFGYLMILTGIAMALGGIVNAKLVAKVGTARLMTVGWSLMVVAGVLTLLGKYLWGITSYDIIIPAMIFIFGTSFIFSNAVAGAFTPFGHIAGYAGSLYNGIQLLGGAVFSAYLSHLNTSSQLPMAWMFIASGVLAWLAFSRIAKP